MVPIPRRLVLVAAAAATLACFPPAAFAFNPSFPYGSEKIRGVSLGGWLVLEVNATKIIFFWVYVAHVP